MGVERVEQVSDGNLGEKARYSRSKLLSYGVSGIQQKARKLDVDGNFQIDDDKSLVGFVDNVQAKILVSPRVPERFKNKYRGLLSDGKFGPITLKGLEMAISQGSTASMGEDLGAELSRAPGHGRQIRADTSERTQYGKEIEDFQFNPDVIIAMGCHVPHINEKRAKFAMDLLNVKNSEALLVATGTSSVFRKKTGVSEAEGMYEEWKRMGYSDKYLKDMIEKGKLRLETHATNSVLNIRNTFSDIVSRAYQATSSSVVKVCLVTDSKWHAGRLITYLKNEWEKYVSDRRNHPFNLQVGCYFGSGSYVLSPWVCEEKVEEPPKVAGGRGVAVGMDVGSVGAGVGRGMEDPGGGGRSVRAERPSGGGQAVRTERGPSRSSVENLYNQWEISFGAGQKIYCSGLVGRSGGGFNYNLAKEQLKYKNVKHVISLVNHRDVKGVVKDLRSEGMEIDFVGFLHHNESKEGHMDHNRKLWEYIADLINKGESFIVHCMNGAHRGPTALTCGLMASGKVKSLGEAISMVGLKIGNFKPFPGMVWQMITFARENGLVVEREYVDFYRRHMRSYDKRLDDDLVA